MLYLCNVEFKDNSARQLSMLCWSGVPPWESLSPFSLALKDETPVPSKFLPC